MQTGEHAERDERNRDENTHAAFPCKLDLVGCAPVDRIPNDTQIQQYVVQVAVFILDDVIPDGSLNDQRGRPRKDDDRTRQLAAMEFLVERHRDDEAEQRGQTDDRNHPHHRIEHHRAEHRRRNGLFKIRKADEAADNARLGNLAERELEDDANRENDENRHQQDAWQQPDIRFPLVTHENGIQTGLPPCDV